MRYKSIVKTALMLFSLMLLLNIAASAQKQDCSKMTDDQIVEAVYEKIKTKYSSQMRHINVRVKGKVVTLEGWATTKKIKKEIEGYAKKLKCKKVDSKLTVGIGSGCGPGQKQCGSICIPEDERCNIRG